MTWTQLWAVAVYELRLTSEQFWRLTPKQFWALLERYREGERRKDARAALVAATMANIFRDPQKRSTPYSVADFLDPEPNPEQEQSELTETIKRLQAMADYEV